MGNLQHHSAAIPTELSACLQAYVGAIGQLLPEAESAPKSEAARRAEQLGREAMYIGSCLAAGIPRHTRTLYCLKLQEAGPEHSRAPDALWAQITQAMQLSAAQKQVPDWSSLVWQPQSCFRHARLPSGCRACPCAAHACHHLLPRYWKPCGLTCLHGLHARSFPGDRPHGLAPLPVLHQCCPPRPRSCQMYCV